MARRIRKKVASSKTTKTTKTTKAKIKAKTSKDSCLPRPRAREYRPPPFPNLDPTHPFPFLSLAPEIRQQIYQHLLPSTHTTIHLIRKPPFEDYWEWYYDYTRHTIPWPFTPTLAEVENPARKYPVVQPSRESCIEVSYAEGNGSYPKTTVSDMLALRSLTALTQTCQITHGEVMPLLAGQLTVRAQDISAACWYGLTRPSLASSCITRLIIDKPLSQGMSLPATERWLTQLLQLFPALECLRIHGVHQHKNPDMWGSAYSRDDLRMMKFVVDNSRLCVVAVKAAKHGDKCSVVGFTGGECFPVCEFVKRDVAGAHLGEFPYTIDVEEELARCLNGKKRRDGG